MAKRRGFFAEIQHQAAVAEKKRKQEESSARRITAAQQREWEKAQRAAVRAQEAAGRADAKERAAAEREAKRLHVEAMSLAAETMTGEAQSFIEEIDNVLQATLDHDDYVDLESLRQVAEHPPFRSQNEAPTPQPVPIEAGPEPVFQAPPEPTGLKAMFGGKAKYAGELAAARRDFEAAHDEWRNQAAQVPMKQLAQMQAYQEAETSRLERLAQDRQAYDTECDERSREVQERNNELDTFIAAFGAGEQGAVEQYFEIVLGNSVYPENLDVAEEVSYDSSAREVTVKLFLPLPDAFPQEKGSKYVKSKDELVEIPRTATELKRTYANFVQQVALRTLHEIWEADRTGLVDTISLIAGTDNLSPATGQEVYTPLVAVAVDRETFESINLANVQASESLKHLKGIVSKDPINFVPVELSKGVRG